MNNVEQCAILLVTYNRPEFTKKVLEKLRLLKKRRLYIFNDGAREGNATDLEARKKIITFINDIKWECELFTLYSDVNMGCGKGVSSAITWAFQKEDRLIILEDDCVPAASFFSYCDQMLDRYENDNRLWVVCGENHYFPRSAFADKDYLFSQFGFNCGWATWKRCWNQFDIEMKVLPLALSTRQFYNAFYDNSIGEAYHNRYSRMKVDKARPRFWTSQFGLSIILNRGMFIIPRENLIENIGVEGDHSSSVSEFHYQKTSDDFVVVKHPIFVLPDRDVEHYHITKRVKPMLRLIPKHTKIINKIIKLLQR